jgi:hypothetical protein
VLHAAGAAPLVAVSTLVAIALVGAMALGLIQVRHWIELLQSNSNES